MSNTKKFELVQANSNSIDKMVYYWALCDQWSQRPLLWNSSSVIYASWSYLVTTRMIAAVISTKIILHRKWWNTL